MPLNWEHKLGFAPPDAWLESPPVPPEVAGVVERVAQAAGSARTFQIFVVEDQAINALSMPRGFVALTTGLVAQVESQEALAFVLAREIGHFEHRYHLLQMSRRVVFGLARSVLFGSTTVGTVIERAEMLAHLRYSRRQEEQADAFALSCLHAAYGHVSGATAFFATIESHNDAVEFLQTHPLSQSRIETLQQSIRRMGLPRRPVTPLS